MYFKAAKTLSDAFEKKLEEMERESEQINMPALDAMERCGILLGDMAKNPYAEWFCEPVDHVNLGLHDYLQVIKEPQDLGTISKKYERQQYMSPEDLARDVRLVWQNAITYNSASSMFGVVASILAQVFDRRFALITRSSFGDPGRPIPDRPGYPTFTQKKKFYDLCTKLTLADLNQMVSLVQRGCGSAVQQCGDKEVEVDVDELDNETFNKVMSWAQEKTKAKATAKRHATISPEWVVPAEPEKEEVLDLAGPAIIPYSEPLYFPYDWEDPDANPDFRTSAFFVGIATNDKYAAWCKALGCPAYNTYARSWCSAGGDDACKNECRLGKCPTPPIDPVNFLP